VTNELFEEEPDVLQGQTATHRGQSAHHEQTGQDSSSIHEEQFKIEGERAANVAKEVAAVATTAANEAKEALTAEMSKSAVFRHKSSQVIGNLKNF
jgi:hypothetical protein